MHLHPIADVGKDHTLLSAIIRIRLKRIQKQKMQKKVDVLFLLLLLNFMQKNYFPLQLYALLALKVRIKLV